MAWWQFSLNCQASELEQVENLMMGLGALSITLSDAGDEPIYEPLPGENPVWQESVVAATFAGADDHEQIYQQMARQLPDHLASGIRLTTLEDQDWEQAYKQHFKPLQCAPNLWIVPSWLEAPDPDATVIQLDPGLAFGTGGHATTALCLAWLGNSQQEYDNVIDYGCGSGILAIAAIKLGARNAIAVDIDPQALVSCRSNMLVNGIDSGQIQVVTPNELDTPPSDLVIANILAGPLVDLASRFADLVRPGGHILLSGILETQLQDILLAYKPYFELDPAITRDEWVCVSGTRL